MLNIVMLVLAVDGGAVDGGVEELPTAFKIGIKTQNQMCKVRDLNWDDAYFFEHSEIADSAFVYYDGKEPHLSRLTLVDDVVYIAERIPAKLTKPQDWTFDWEITTKTIAKFISTTSTKFEADDCDGWCTTSVKYKGVSLRSEFDVDKGNVNTADVYIVITGLLHVELQHFELTFIEPTALTPVPTFNVSTYKIPFEFIGLVSPKACDED